LENEKMEKGKRNANREGQKEKKKRNANREGQKEKRGWWWSPYYVE
jgi:hypothetical protein